MFFHVGIAKWKNRKIPDLSYFTILAISLKRNLILLWKKYMWCTRDRSKKKSSAPLEEKASTVVKKIAQVTNSELRRLKTLFSVLTITWARKFQMRWNFFLNCIAQNYLQHCAKRFCKFLLEKCRLGQQVEDKFGCKSQASCKQVTSSMTSFMTSSMTSPS